MGSAVAYDNRVKESALGVKKKTLKAFGAVSKQTAVEMALGALKKLKGDISASITGIAGPGGGSPKKPVGTVFICVSCRGRTAVKKFLFKGSRKSVKKQSAEAALVMLSKALGVKTERA